MFLHILYYIQYFPFIDYLPWHYNIYWYHFHISAWCIQQSIHIKYKKGKKMFYQDDRISFLIICHDIKMIVGIGQNFHIGASLPWCIQCSGSTDGLLRPLVNQEVALGVQKYITIFGLFFISRFCPDSLLCWFYYFFLSSAAKIISLL